MSEQDLIRFNRATLGGRELGYVLPGAHRASAGATDHVGVSVSVTEDVSDRLVRFPFHNQLSDADLEGVVGAMRVFDCAAAAV